MEYFVLFTLGALLAVLGILGCFVPILPGPILAYASLWMFPSHVGATRLSLAGAAVLLATIIDYVLPAVVSKKFNCSKLGVTGCFIGTIVGVFFFPLGLILFRFCVINIFRPKRALLESEGVKFIEGVVVR